jgi:hypothetical protein
MHLTHSLICRTDHVVELRQDGPFADVIFTATENTCMYA